MITIYIKNDINCLQNEQNAYCNIHLYFNVNYLKNLNLISIMFLISAFFSTCEKAVFDKKRKNENENNLYIIN